MRIYQRVGRRADALKQYQSCVETLRRELNVEPEVATTRLYQEIRRRPDETDASSEPAAPQPRDEPHALHDELPGMFLTFVRRRYLAPVAGLSLFFALAAIVLLFAV